ncbi:MAG: 6-carboxytetrahydropterin synthase QueD [Spirochaetaceae bacterium]|nr:6-carboxytetrahydropterin synthase QueD [Spirochaetaceae bacterium]
MYELRVRADFAAAHFLRDFHGRCENLHGHNYAVYAHVRGETLGEGGMVADFGVIKQCLREVCAALDHTCLNDMAVFEQNPSAERIARHIFEGLEDALGERGVRGLFAVDVFETPENRARYLGKR